MKLRAATAHEGVPAERKPAVEPGKLYGRLRVVREAVGRRIQNSRAWECVCVNQVDGRECGTEVVKPTHYLTKVSFRACPSCADAHQREVRQNWGRALTRR